MKDTLTNLLNAVGTPDGFNGNPVTPEDWATIEKQLPTADWVLVSAATVGLG